MGEEQRFRRSCVSAWDAFRRGVSAPLFHRVLQACGIVIGGSLILGLAGYGALRVAEPAIPQGSDFFSLNRPPAYTFLDRNGGVAGQRGAYVGERVDLNELPPYVAAAFLTVEDRRFYRHTGIDPRGLLRALIVDIKAKRFVQGGSTVTQQLVKILFLTPDRTVGRKITEIAGAMELERRLSKEDILALYLNRIYLGSGAYGVDGAARVYFGKSARDLDLAEAAMLAGLTRSPSTYSPRRDLGVAQMRAGRVIDAMLSQGVITQDQAANARAHPARIIPEINTVAADYFLDVAVDEARELANGVGGDLTVSTTFDPSMQQMAQKQVTDLLKRNGKAAAASQAALVAMTPEGAVRAIVGGRSYAESTFNRATQARRQPGSTFKPFVYLAALEYGLSPWTVRSGAASTSKGDYAPRNYGGAQWGDVTLEQGLVRSINTVTVNLQSEIGVNAVASTAQRLGITSRLSRVASLALGTSEVTPLELTAAYASFASTGLKAAPHTVTEIRSSHGDILYRRQSIERARVIDEDNALAMNAMLYHVVQNGTGRAAAVPGREVAGKTGTSADHHDAWFIGYSADLVTGVWVGNDDASPMKRVTGGSLPAKIWSGFMRQALAEYPATPLPRALPEPLLDMVAYTVDGDFEGQNGANGYFVEPPLDDERQSPPPELPSIPDVQILQDEPPPYPRTMGDLEAERRRMVEQIRAARERQNRLPYPDEGFYRERDFPDYPDSRPDEVPMRGVIIRPDGSWEAVP